MSWQGLYQQGWITAEQTISHVKPGDRVVVAHATGEPSVLTDVMVEDVGTCRNVEIVHMVAVDRGEYYLPEYTENFRHSSLFLGILTRDAIAEGREDFILICFSQIPDLLRGGLHPNVALSHLSPPDERGYCSYGVSVDYTKPTTRIVGLHTAQVNSNMPRTLGDSFIHVNELDCIVKVDDPIIELGQAKIGETECATGEHYVSLIQDGDYLQPGIGAIPDAVLLLLRGKKDLGIRSEAFSDDVVELVEAGVITSRRKTLHRGQCIVTFLMGSKRLYDYVNNNPSVATYPTDYVNNLAAIAKNDSLVSINSCIQVNLVGQAISDSIGPWQFSDVSSQVGFVRGASLSRNDKSTMATPSSLVKRDSTHVSKITVQADAGAAVTTSRYDTNYTVTEFSIAKLKGKTLHDRAKALTEIAYPDFREELMEEFHRHFGV